MTATVRLTDGSTITAPLVAGGGEAVYPDWGNPGLPDNWGNNWPPQPIFFDSVDIVAPGKAFLLGTVCDVPPPFLPDQPWKVCRPGQFYYRNFRNGKVTHAAYDRAGHFIDGGVRMLPFRMVPADDPWELRLLAKRTPAQFAKAAYILNLDDARVARWPWLKKMLDLYRFDASSLNPFAPPGTRNEGWLHVPEHFMSRWQGHPGGEAAIRHWYGFGTKQAGVSLSNEHYGHEADWIASGMRNGANPKQAVLDLTVGLYLLRWKIAFGLIDCDAPNPHKGRWRNESGSDSRGTAGMQPSAAKEYDLGLCLAHTLLPEDPLIARGFQVRLDYWLHSGQPWSGNGGARNLGRALQNLLIFYRTVDNLDARFALKDKARQFIDWAKSVNGARMFFKDTSPDQCSAGEGVSALAYCARWCDEGVRPDLRDHWAQMGAWYEANAGEWMDTAKTFYRAAYFVNPQTAPATPTWSGHFQGLNWLGAPDWCITPAVKAGLEKYMFTVYANTADCDAAFGGEGPGFEKWKPWIMYDGARAF